MKEVAWKPVTTTCYYAGPQGNPYSSFLDYFFSFWARCFWEPVGPTTVTRPRLEPTWTTSTLPYQARYPICRRRPACHRWVYQTVYQTAFQNGLSSGISSGAPLSTSPGSPNLTGTHPALQLAPESELDLGPAAARPKVTRWAGFATGWDPLDEGAPFTAAPAKVSSGAPAAAFAIASQRLYPGESLVAESWSNPLYFEPPYYREQTLLRGFTPIDTGQVPPGHTVTPATRIIIPSVNVDSAIRELAILDLGGSRAYETPANTVGHIPATANAGEANGSWFFGHTESPTLGEGSVFFNLRDIPDKLRRGEDVYIIADNGQHQYLYRATSSRVVHQRELRLYETGLATIHLVSCVPRLVYDHRLIISGELVAIK